MLRWTHHVEWTVRYNEGVDGPTVLRPIAKVSFGSRAAKKHAVERWGFPSRGTACISVVEGKEALRRLGEHFDLSDEERTGLHNLCAAHGQDAEILCYAYYEFLKVLPLYCRTRCAKFMRGER